METNKKLGGGLLARLDGVVAHGNRRYSARCPAHNDRSPSLSVRETDDGKILVFCHAGCATDEVLTAVGLTFSDLYPDRWNAAYRAATANRGASFRKRLERETDPLDVERWVLRIASADIRASKTLSVEDRARVDVAVLRLKATEGVAA